MQSPPPPLYEVVARGSLIATKKALAAGAPIDQQDENGDTALCIASAEGHYSIVEFLLSQGADTTVCGSEGRTPLHQAVSLRKQAVVTLLLADPEKAAAYVNIPDEYGDTPLHAAVSIEEDVFIEQLLRCGAEVSYEDMNGKSSFLCANKKQQAFINRVCNQEKAKLLKGFSGHITSEKDKESVFAAVRGGNVELAAVLLKDANERDTCGNSLLFHAVQTESIGMMEMLLQKKADPRYGITRESSAYTPLHYACMGNTPELVTLLIRGQADVNIRDWKGRTPIHYASEWKKPLIIGTLLSHQADPTAGDMKQQTPLHLAAATGRLVSVHALAPRLRGRLDQVDQDGRTALHLAAFWDWIKVIQELVREGASLEATDKAGDYPIHLAVRYNKIRAVSTLLELKADPTLMNSDGITPVHLARTLKREKILDILAEAGYVAPANKVSKHKRARSIAASPKIKKEIKAAVAAGNPEALAQLLTRADKLEDKLVHDMLFRAARSGHGEIMEVLLDDERVEIDLATVQDENGQNLLHAAVTSRSADLVEELLMEEVPVNHKDNKQDTPLHLAISKRSTPTPLIQSLCRNGADLSIPNRDGNTALHLVFLHPCKENLMVERVTALVESSTPEQLNQLNNAGATPLLCAASHHECVYGAVRALLNRRRVDVNLPDAKGLSPLQWAIKRNHTRLCQKLVLNGATVSDELLQGLPNRLADEILDALEEKKALETKSSGAGENVSQLFSDLFEAGNVAAAQKWVSQGGDVNITDEEQSTPLHVASLHGHEAVVSLLLTAKSDPNANDSNLQTPLHCAALKGHTGVVQVLLAQQADPNVYDSEDQTPLDWAILLEHDAVADLLTPITS